MGDIIDFIHHKERRETKNRGFKLKSDFTICANCTHFRSKKDGPRTGNWYNLSCSSPDVRREEVINPVSGKKCFKMVNDLGRTVFVDECAPYPGELNLEGSCPYYKRKGTSVTSIVGRILKR